MVAGLLDLGFLGIGAVAAGHDQGLVLERDRLHVPVEDGDVELAVLERDFAVDGFVGAELEDAAAVRAEFNAAVAECAGNAEQQPRGDGEEWFLHVVSA